MPAERLRELDNRVLKIDVRMAELRTEEGWRGNAARWRWLAGLSTVTFGWVFLADLLGADSFTGLVFMGGIVAFHAGLLKGEGDRLNNRGDLNRRRPPGL